MLRSLYLILLIVFCFNEKSTSTITTPAVKYPQCAIRILFAIENLQSLETPIFQKQINFLLNQVFEEWNHFEQLAILRNGDFKYEPHGFFESKSMVKDYIRSIKQVKKHHRACKIFNEFYNEVESRIIVLLNEFYLSDVEDDCIFSLKDLNARKNSVAIIPLSDKVNTTILNHYFKQAKVIAWNITKETPDDWENQFNTFYDCKDYKTTTSGYSIGTTTENSTNSYPPCNTKLTIVFDKSNGLTNKQFDKEKDFLVNHVFKNWTRFSTLDVYSFSDHMYSIATPFESKNELIDFIQNEEKVDVDSDFCNFLYYTGDNFGGIEGSVIIFLSKYNMDDFFKERPKWDIISCEDVIEELTSSNVQFTFVILNDELDADNLRRHVPLAQFIKLDLFNISQNWEWNFLTAYECNQDDYNDQSAYPCNSKFIFGFEVSTAIDKHVLDAQKSFLVNNVFNNNWNVFNNLAFVAYSNETITKDFGTMSNIEDVNSFIDKSFKRINASRTSLCSVFKLLTTMYLKDVNIIIFVDEFHQQIGRDECKMQLKQLRENINTINFVSLTKNVNHEYLALKFPQAIFSSWNTTTNLPTHWNDITFYGCQDFIVDSAIYPCYPDFNGGVRIIYDRSHYLSPFAYQRLQYFLLKKVFIKQWTNRFDIYAYPDFKHLGSEYHTESDLFILRNLRIPNEPLFCSFLVNIGEDAAFDKFLFFVSKFDKDVLASDGNCNDAIKKINTLSKVTFIKLGRLVNTTLLKQTFVNATIVEWNIETDKEPLYWNQMLWTAFGCPGNSTIKFPTKPKSTSFHSPTTKIQTTTTLQDFTTSGPNKQSTAEFTQITTTDYSILTTTTTQSPNRSNALVISLSVLVPLFVIFSIGGIVCFCCYRKRKRDEMVDQMVFASPRNENDTQHNEAQYRTEEEIDLWRIDSKNVKFFANKKLGSGASASVFLGKLIGDAGIKRVYPNIIALRQFSNCEVAVKVLPFYATELNKEDFKQEISFMQNLKYHAHIVCLLGYTEEQILLEYCANGDLMHFLKRNKDTFETEEGLKLKDLISFAWQVANGMEYFSSLNLVHRDLAARNILLTNENICKVSDFGLSRTDNAQSYTSKRRMPVRWLPPEALKSFEYSTKTDVWSYGVLLFEVFTIGEFPYSELENTEILSFIDSGNRLEKPEHATTEIYELMLNCWNSTPETRPNFTQICQSLIPILDVFNISYNYVSPVETVVEETNELAIFDDYFTDDCSV